MNTRVMERNEQLIRSVIGSCIGQKCHFGVLSVRYRTELSQGVGMDTLGSRNLIAIGSASIRSWRLFSRFLLFLEAFITTMPRFGPLLSTIFLSQLHNHPNSNISLFCLLPSHLPSTLVLSCPSSRRSSHRSLPLFVSFQFHQGIGLQLRGPPEPPQGREGARY